ncbi:MAG: hypothetical protein ACQEXJ_19285 [Myxococcota bacterium]
MLGAVVELVSLVVAFVGGLIHLRRATGRGRLLGFAPMALFVVGQLVPAVLRDAAPFSTLYPVALVIMGLAGALGLYLMMHLPAPPPGEDDPLL